MASLYAVYHGPDGLKRIARRVHAFTRILSGSLKRTGLNLASDAFFDTVSALDALPRSLLPGVVLVEGPAASTEIELREGLQRTIDEAGVDQLAPAAGR